MNKFINVIALLLMALWLGDPSMAADHGRNLAVNQVNNAVSEHRVALVIGNSAYANSSLKNPVNDAHDIASKLRGLGFVVIERTNLQTRQIGSTLREFRSKLVPGAVALVFYAGHGLQIKGDNYLPAVDAEINSEEDVPNQSLAVEQILDVLDAAKTRLNLVFLDACRNNPYARSFRSSDRGLARISAPSGTLISYATRPGSVAADGEGRNGLYTSKLLAQMDSNVQIEQTLKRVVTEVKAASQGKQEPWMEGSIEGDFCFAGCAASGGAQVASLESVPAPVRVKSREEIEQETWERARDTNNIETIQEYIRQYPKGRFVGQANVLITNLKATSVKSAELGISPAGRYDAESDLWNEVQKGGTTEDYRAYLGQYPKGKYAALAKGRLKKLDDEAAQQARLERDAAARAAGARTATTASADKSSSAKRPTLETRGNHNVVINGKRLSDAEITQIERAYQIRIGDANYWYDRVLGAWGVKGGPTMGFIVPGLNLGGSLRPDASGGGTRIFVNGRALHPTDVMALQQITGPILPGRYFITGQGLAGYEGGPPMWNLARMAEQAQGGGGGSRTWQGRITGSSGFSDGTTGAVFLPNGGIVSTGQ